LIGDDVELVDSDGKRLGVLETDGWMLDDRDTDVVLGPEGWLDGLVGGWAGSRSSVERCAGHRSTGRRWQRWPKSPRCGRGSRFDVLAHGPFLRAVVLHEDGVFGEFLAARDRLLPDDEALLAAQRALVDRGVFEVLERTGTELDLRTVVTGDRIRIVNAHPSDIREGMLLVGWPLPVGESYRAFSGFMPLPPGHQDAMLAAITAVTARRSPMRSPPCWPRRGSPTPMART